MIEEALSRSLFNGNNVRGFTDKLLGREDVEEIRQIIKKKNLEREDILDLIYLMSSTESKLVNFNEWERYVIVKFFIWIRETARMCEYIFDYEDYISEKKTKSNEYIVTEETKKLLKNNRQLIEHTIKYLVDLYLMIARTSLSIKGGAFHTLSTNKFEITYPQAGLNTPEKKGV